MNVGKAEQSSSAGAMSVTSLASLLTVPPGLALMTASILVRTVANSRGTTTIPNKEVPSQLVPVSPTAISPTVNNELPSDSFGCELKLKLILIYIIPQMLATSRVCSELACRSQHTQKSGISEQEGTTGSFPTDHTVRRMVEPVS